MQGAEYSGVNGALYEVFTILNFYKHVNKELLYESSRINEQETEMTDKNQVIGVLSDDLDQRFKSTQRQTALKVLQKYYKNI